MEGHQFFDAKESMGGKMGHQSFGALSCLTRFFVFISKGALEMKIIFFPSMSTVHMFCTKLGLR